jgi:hypothetical protein
MIVVLDGFFANPSKSLSDGVGNVIHARQKSGVEQVLKLLDDTSLDPDATLADLLQRSLMPPTNNVGLSPKPF